jgi:site-specific recombinase XerD
LSAGRPCASKQPRQRTVPAAPAPAKLAVREKAATADIVIAMSPTATSLRALRNRAIILLGFAGALRRSELVSLNVDDLEETAEGMLVTLRRSKTDQEGRRGGGTWAV